jgi:hypothetical protein
MIHLDEHLSDFFSNDRTMERGGWYWAAGVPDLFFDGGSEMLGSTGHCDGDQARDREVLRARLVRSRGMSPVAIDGAFAIQGDVALLSADFMLVDPLELGVTRATFFLYEDDITYCCDPSGNDHWDRICRYIDYRPILLRNPGDVASASTEIPLDPSWNVSNLHAVVILEKLLDPKQIFQASGLPCHGIDFALSAPGRVASVRAGEGEARFRVSVRNLAIFEDQVTLEVDQGAGWPTDFQVEGDPQWRTTAVLPLAGGQGAEITVRIQTDAVPRKGIAGFTTRSAGSGRAQLVQFTVFNGSPAILLVDDDGGWDHQGTPYEQPFRDALEHVGYLYDWWDAKHDHGGVGPRFEDEIGYDAVLWATAYEIGGVLDSTEVAGIEAYLDSGGAFYLDSMGFLTGVPPSDEFTIDYLGAASWTIDTRATAEDGVPGDPITDGMRLPLTWYYSGLNRTDTVNPSPSAAVILYNELGRPNALRNTTASGARVVFSTVPQDAISQTAPDPSNSATLLRRILFWLLRVDPSTATPEPAAWPPATPAALRASPNPLVGQTRFDLQLSRREAVAPVHLVLVDAAGRAVRSLIDGPVESGSPSVLWDGRNGAGRPVPPGIYFARLNTIEGRSSAKVVLVGGAGP